MNDPSTSQMQNVLKDRIKDLKNETSDLMKEIVGYIDDGNMNECLRNLGNLEDTLKNTYELVDRLSDRIDELERNVNELKQELNKLKDQVKYVKFFADYRDWAKIFMQLLIEKLGGTDNWHKAETGLHYRNRNEPMTEKESECVERLTNLLKEDTDIGLGFTDIKLLLEVRDTSNIMFHKNNQTSREAEMKLYAETLPDNLKIYKPPLKKAFKTISRWRSS
ncbi:2226_t:CDS:1 [Funneliformis geosporum]|uniref:6271_t:CDS:1 n=1 Tax=Funneliformis geosporum TaxID=1117311 RepID=A0A9W4SUS9_9GLOM|nr:6271_t:CDS:1 [Funneliformis geosporum]CAI2184088.1 2226_t:CDS:1 [Funneliformis geosporum]